MNQWQFVVTEIDQVSYECAVDNVKRNNADNNIKGWTFWWWMGSM